MCQTDGYSGALLDPVTKSAVGAGGADGARLRYLPILRVCVCSDNANSLPHLPHLPENAPGSYGRACQ